MGAKWTAGPRCFSVWEAPPSPITRLEHLAGEWVSCVSIQPVSARWPSASRTNRLADRVSRVGPRRESLRPVLDARPRRTRNAVRVRFAMEEPSAKVLRGQYCAGMPADEGLRVV